MSTLEDLNVDVTVVLGQNRMPVHMLLRMGRGAVIELEATETDMVEILANDYPVARGQVTTVCCVMSPDGSVRPIPVPVGLAETIEEAP